MEADPPPPPAAGKGDAADEFIRISIESDDTDTDRVESSRETKYVKGGRPGRLDKDTNCKLFAGVDPLPSRGSPTPTGSTAKKGFFKEESKEAELVPSFDSLRVAEPMSLPSMPSMMAAATVDAGNPLKTKQVAAMINGIRTEIILTSFTDRVFILITQFKKLGTLIHATSAEVVGTGEKVFDVRVQLGRRDDPLLLVYGRQIIEQISNTSPKPLLLGIALKERSSAVFQAIVNLVLQNKVW